MLLAIVFGGQKDAIPYWCLGALQELDQEGRHRARSRPTFSPSMQTTTDHTGAIFFLVVAAVWFGTSNAAREIVSERAIYMRERMVNLGLFNYVLSKFILLAFFCVIQCTVLLGIVFFALGFHGGPQAFVIELAVDHHHVAQRRRHRPHALDGRRLERGGDGAHADRAHPAGRARRADGAR